MATWRRAVLALAVLATAFPLFALEVLLLNRQRYVGDVRINPDTVFVKVDKTTYQIPRGSVREVRLYGAERLDYERRKAQLGISAESHYQFARWLDSMLQNAEAQTYYQKAIELDPDHAAAREALGYRKTDGKWTLSDEDHWRVHSTWLGPEGANGCYELARIYQKAGDDRRAELMLRRALIALTEHHDALVMIRPYTDKYVSKNKYRLPMEGVCVVINDHNQHHRSAAFMQYGLDFMKADEKFSLTRTTDPKRVEDYYTWDAPIVACADGEVYSINDGYEDSPLGTSGDFFSANTVCIKHAGGEYTVYGHLKNGSICVKKGQKVKAGDVIGRGGNSGSSFCPHMHWAMYDRDGIGLPATFVNFTDLTGGREEKVESGKLSENHVYRNSASAGDGGATK